MMDEKSDTVEAIRFGVNAGGVTSGHATAEDDGAACTIPDGAETATVDPEAFDAVTATRNVAPWSADTSSLLAAVAPLIAEQAAPLASQRRHA
jgi:hypothetical protein